jgi:hypothetical protein
VFLSKSSFESFTIDFFFKITKETTTSTATGCYRLKHRADILEIYRATFDSVLCLFYRSGTKSAGIPESSAERFHSCSWLCGFFAASLIGAE